MTSEKDGDNASTMHPLLRRAFIYLEDGEWKAADEYCEKVLDQEPENAEAYLGKLMAELHCPNRACLMKQEKPFDEMGNYKRTLRFASPELKAELMEYMAYINDRNEQNRISSLDNVACQKMESAHTEEANQSACLRNQASYIAAKAKKKRVKTVIGTVVLFSLLVSIIFVIFWNQVRIPNREYSKALELYNNGLYMEAIAVWDALGDYKDSKERSTHAKYLQAGQFYCEGNFEAAITIFEELGDYKDSSERVLNHNNNQLKLYQMRNCSVGDTVRFGRYEQDNDITNGDEEIEWIVLEKEDNRILVISKYILDAVQYNKYKTDITWENCTLRGWLNSSFLDEAFAVEEQPWIPAVTVANADNPNYGTPAGNTTTDRIFLLSLDEFAQYFGSNHLHFRNTNDWVGRGTAYAKAKGLYMDDNDLSWWWLRTPGVHADDVARVSTGSGSSRSEGYGVDYSYDGLRPAMWISFEETKAPDTNNDQKEYGNSEAQNAYVAGDTVKFGRYEQDIYSDGKEEIEWTVLAVKDNRMLVVSKRILDCAPYNSIKKDVTWETCTLRSWLNGAFLTETFTEEELARIPSVTVRNNNNPQLGPVGSASGTSGGNDTTDRVFLLSINEVEQYFQSDDDRKASGTEYAKEKNLSVAENGYSLWRLRSPGASPDYAATVSYAGKIIYIGADVSFKRGGIRPAMWIEINP